MDLIILSQGRDRWRALVNAEMNLRIQCNEGFFFCLAEDLLAFQRFGSMEFVS